MKLQNRIELLEQLKKYLNNNDAGWTAVKDNAAKLNGWFTPEFIDAAVYNITEHFLDKQKLQSWVGHYHLNDSISPRNVGIVMAGNIPLVGFHDFLAVFVSGHIQTIKLSSKDEVLLKHLVQKMYEWDPAAAHLIRFAPMLNGCDAYIATGSNNSARYFHQYFSKYPSIIRRNRTSVAILSGNETTNDLEKLSDDIHMYFGLGCRNVTKIYVPYEYDFVPLIKAFHKYSYFADHNKYRNNFDYNLSLHIMNNRYYMTDNTTLLVEDEQIFSPISQVNYSFYKVKEEVLAVLQNNENVQCVVGTDVAFGKSQTPSLMDYADGVDTMQFLLTL